MIYFFLTLLPALAYLLGAYVQRRATPLPAPADFAGFATLVEVDERTGAVVTTREVLLKPVGPKRYTVYTARWLDASAYAKEAR